MLWTAVECEVASAAASHSPRSMSSDTARRRRTTWLAKSSESMYLHAIGGRDRSSEAHSEKGRSSSTIRRGAMRGDEKG